MATIPPPALAVALDTPRRRRIVPAAHLRLADAAVGTTITSTLDAPKTKKGEVATFIRSMPNAPARHVVEAAKEKGIETTIQYVRWRRWADRKGKGARVKTTEPPPMPRDVPAMFRGGLAGITSDDVEETVEEEAETTPTTATNRTRGTSAKISITEASFRRALGAYVVEHGVARVRVVVDDLEAELLAVASS